MTSDVAPRRSTRDRKLLVPTMNENLLSQDLLDADKIMVQRSRSRSNAEDDDDGDDNENGDENADDVDMNDDNTAVDDDFVERSNKRRSTDNAGGRGGASRARGRGSRGGGRGRGSRGRGRGGSRGGGGGGAGDAMSTPARAPRQRRGKAGTVDDATEAAVSDNDDGDDPTLPDLFNGLTRSNNSVKAFVNEFHESFADKRSSARALVDLLNTLIASCNTSAQLTLSDIGNISAEEVSQLVEQLDDTEYIQQTETPFKRFKRFPVRFKEFWYRLINTMPVQMFALDSKRATIPTLFQRLLTWFFALSSSPVRSFRDTVTTAYLTIMTALSDRHVSCLGTLAQLETQRSTIESRSKVNDKQLKQLDEQIAAIETTVETIANVVRAYFSAVFTHRWRDVDSNIRAMCIESLGHWIITNKPLFLLGSDRDTYLKYIAWTLNDRDVKVRKTSLSVLTQLYRQSDAEMMTNLSALTTRYFQRINQMCDDVDSSVSALAVECMNVLLKAGRLSEADGNHILQLLWADTQDIRYAAADFVYEDTFADVHANDEVKPASTADNQTDITQLLHIFDAHCPSASAFRQSAVSDQSLINIDESDLSRPFALLVDSFWNRLPCLQDWNAFTSLILWTVADKSDNRRKSMTAPPAEEGEIAIIPLLYLFAAAVRHANGHDIGVTHKLSKVDKDELVRVSQACTTHLIHQLPEQLQAFTSDSHAARILLSLISVVNVDMYSGLKKLDELQLLLNAIKSIYLAHSDQALLNEGGIALSALSGDHTYSEFSQTTVTELSTQLSSQWKNEAKAVNERHGLRTNDDDKAAALSAILKRIVGLYQAIYSVDLSWVSSPLYARVMHAYQQEHSHNNAATALIALLQIAYTDLTWQYTHLHDEAEQTKTVDHMALSSAVDHQNVLLSAVESLLKESTSTAVKDHCFRLLTDLFVLATGKLNNTVLQPLAISTQRLRELQSIYNATVVSLIETTNVDNRIDDEMDEVTEEQRGAIIADCRVLALINASKVVAYDHTSMPANAAKSVTLRHGELSAIVIGCFTQFGDECDQIIKALMSELKSIGTNVLLYAQFIALRQLHRRQSVDIKHLKTMAQRLALLFSFAPNVSFVGFMKVAISYALNDAPTNLNFLDVIVPFLQRTPLRDILPIQRYLNDAKRIEMDKSALDETALDEMEWAPLKQFSDVLSKKALKASAKDDVDRAAAESTRSPALSALSPIPLISTPAAAADRSSSSRVRRQLPTTPEVAEEEVDEAQDTSLAPSNTTTPLSTIREARKRGRLTTSSTDVNGVNIDEEPEAVAVEDDEAAAVDEEEEVIERRTKRGRRAHA